MKLTISKQDAIDMFSEKYPDTEIEDVLFVDDEGEALVNATDVVETITTDDENLCSEDDDDDDDFDADSSSEDFVAATGIVKVLKKALEDQGYKNRIPDNPDKTCEDAAEDFFNKLKRREKRIIVDVMRTNGIKKFLLLWQDYQNFIHTKL